MYINKISLKNFRCLAPYDITITAPVVLITGPNGTGKTTILEAIYYACYLRSFRTYIPRELITFQHDSFIINLSFEAAFGEQSMHHDLHVGFDRKKKLVKVDGKAIQTYKDLLDYYRVISITTDDMQLIAGNPQERRTFIDQALSLLDPSYVVELRTYKTILQNKNALLHTSSTDDSLYHLWNEQLWKKTCSIQRHRTALLDSLQKETSILLSSFFGESVLVDMDYRARLVRDEGSYQEFMKNQEYLPQKERAMHRSLFGAHLDDIAIRFDARQSKLYASRGQQKLTVCMMKAALAYVVMEHKGKVVLVLDDFMGDFDATVLDRLYGLLRHLNCQLIFTSPTNQGYLEQKLLGGGAQEIILTHSKL